MKSVIVIFIVLSSTTILTTQDFLTGLPTVNNAAGNACCSYPCENNGICTTQGFDKFTCDCTGLDYYGDRCQHPTTWKKFVLFVKPSSETVHNLLVDNKWFWTIINNISFLKNAVMKRIYLVRSFMVNSPALYESVHEYPTFEAAVNYSYFARTLPPVPLDCPTPMGAKGKKELPNVDLLVDKFFKRTTFLPEPIGSNVLFTFFAQHFTHQFFKTDMKAGVAYQWGGHGVDVSHIYGKNKQVELALRTMKDGKMKMQVINGEEYPPYLKDVDVPMTYPPGLPDFMKFALGQQVFGLLPGLFLYATIWLREHNRVSDILKQEHPEWDDERLFQTAKLIIVGETIKIVIEDYVQHLSNYHYELSFNPELLFGESFQYQNRITVEFNHLYHWHPLMPDDFNISGTVYPIKDFVFHSELVVKHGVKDFVQSFVKQRAGLMSHHNHCNMTLGVVRDTLKHGRELRLQPLNRYRQRFGLPAFKSFQELTGDTKLAGELEELYGDIDAVEFYVGLMLEKRRYKAMFGSSIVEIGGPFSVKGLMSNPICSPKHWKPSTFGGEVGFNIIKTASLEKLFCLNMEGECPRISFRVPDYVEGDVDDLIAKVRDEL